MTLDKRRVLKRVYVKGFKSFREIDIELRPINILIGANGAGKSNFISLFKLLRRMARQELQDYVVEAGGVSALLHHGPKKTPEINIELEFTEGNISNFYQCNLTYASGGLLILQERVGFQDRGANYTKPRWKPVSTEKHRESLLRFWANTYRRAAQYVYRDFYAWELYHFHDTSATARIKQMVDIHQNDRLWWDGGNLVAYLYYLQRQHPGIYEKIVFAISLVAPFLVDFHFRPNESANPPVLRLEWRSRGSDMIYGPESLSDGTLRFMCLATLFLQPPEKQPSIILIDEPELGLHPFALHLLAEMVKSTAHYKQIIMTTQSPYLINYFEPEDILVVDTNGEHSTVRRLDPEPLREWLEDYTLGELWNKNLLGGRPEYFPQEDLPF